MSYLDDLERRTATRWPEPQPLPTTPRPTPFPLHVLPAWIAQRCENLAAHMQVPVELPITVAIGVLSGTLTHGHATLAVTDGWVEGANLFQLCAMPPGSGKSPVFRALTEPLDRLADAWAADHEGRAMQLQARKLAADEELRRAKGAADADEILAALQAQQEAQIPDEPIPLADDVNAEALEHVLSVNGGTAVVVSDEAGALDTISRLVESGKSANVQGLLQAWGGSAIRVNRLSRRVNLSSGRAAITLTPQPSVVERLIRGNADFTGRGLSDRFMIAIPPSLVGRRSFIDVHPHDLALADIWAAKVADIGRAHPWGHETAPVAYQLAPDGYEAFNLWRQDMETRRRFDGPLAPLAGIPEKVASSVLRLALILHVADGGRAADKVTASTLAAAIEVGEWWLANALAVYDVARPEIADAQRLVDWLAERRITKGLTEFTLRDVMRSGPLRRSHPSTEDLNPLIEVLIEADLVAPVSRDWRTPKRGMPNPIEVHPDICQMSSKVRDMARHARQGEDGESPDTTESREGVGHVTCREGLDSNLPLSQKTTPQPLPAPLRPEARDMRDTLDDLLAIANEPDPPEDA